MDAQVRRMKVFVRHAPRGGVLALTHDWHSRDVDQAHGSWRSGHLVIGKGFCPALNMVVAELLQLKALGGVNVKRCGLSEC